MKLHDNKPPLMDFGTIQDDMSLLTNNFPLPIPSGDYLTSISELKPGDRVLMAWVGDDAVVIGAV